MLISFYYHFKNSPVHVREAAFHEIQKIMDEPVLHLRKTIHTRWLSYDPAVTAICHTLSSLLTTLEKVVAEKNDVVVQGLVRPVT